MRKIFLSVLLLLCTSACATQQFKVSEIPANYFSKQETSQSFYLWGIGQTKEMSTSPSCNGNYAASEITTTSSPLDVAIGLVQGALIGIQVYSPRTASVSCK